MSHSRRPSFSGYLHINLKCDSSANTDSNLPLFSYYFALDLTTDTLPKVVLTDAKTTRAAKIIHTDIKN
jgi:hypothetical protein